MHPDLSPHLHTDECNDITLEFMNCNVEHKFSRFFGRCDKVYDRMVHCFHLERKAKQLHNNENAIKRQDFVRQKILEEMRQDRERVL
ncbi:COX assembly mitochondrial protein 2 homolog [Daktulosphaira vitifoliae]|uniref:COX assembly mitochondrial protein 2 homolog n=1 Tax=Daktulosphaira vitifoliae TaxID=58002 RepID=UPI0021AAD2DC|nr:COX assembly mitochondrial protein 2 homolog [Daktulosphaira vitifoliae]